MGVDLKIISLPLKRLENIDLSNEQYLLNVFDLENNIKTFILENPQHKNKTETIKQEFINIFNSEELYIDSIWGFEWLLAQQFEIVEVIYLFHKYITCTRLEQLVYETLIEQMNILRLPVENYGLKIAVKDPNITMNYIDSKQIQNRDYTNYYKTLVNKLKGRLEIRNIEYAAKRLIPYLINVQEGHHDLFYFYE